MNEFAIIRVADDKQILFYKCTDDEDNPSIKTVFRPLGVTVTIDASFADSQTRDMDFIGLKDATEEQLLALIDSVGKTILGDGK